MLYARWRTRRPTAGTSRRRTSSLTIAATRPWTPHSPSRKTTPPTKIEHHGTFVISTISFFHRFSFSCPAQIVIQQVNSVCGHFVYCYELFSPTSFVINWFLKYFGIISFNYWQCEIGEFNLKTVLDQ